MRERIIEVMKIKLDLLKSLEANANEYFEKAKKAKAKLQGARRILPELERRHAEQEAKAEKLSVETKLRKPQKHWYHKYRWSRTRKGHLLVAGQNAAANETLIKRHTQTNDVVFHTDMAGSPFTVLKQEGAVSDEDLEDGAVITACYSRAWGKGLGTMEVFHVAPDQVTKEAQAGEYLGRGAFMIRGKTTYHHPRLELGIGVINREGFRPEVFSGSPEACKRYCKEFEVIVPGDRKTSDIAKELQKRFGGEIDDYVKAIPAGGSRTRKK